MIGGGNKNKREEKAESIKIKDFLIRNHTCKICIVCLNEYACQRKNKNKIQKANFIFLEGLEMLGRLSFELENWPLTDALHNTIVFEPAHGKTNNLHMRKQRRRSASR